MTGRKVGYQDGVFNLPNNAGTPNSFIVGFRINSKELGEILEEELKMLVVEEKRRRELCQ